MYGITHPDAQEIDVLESYLDSRTLILLEELGFTFLPELLAYTKKQLMIDFRISAVNLKKIVDAVHSLDGDYRFRDEKYGFNDISEVEITIDHTLNYLQLDSSLFSILSYYIFDVGGRPKKIVTVGDLIGLPISKIEQVPGIGPERLRILLEKIHSLGFCFAGEYFDETIGCYVRGYSDLQIPPITNGNNSMRKAV